MKELKSWITTIKRSGSPDFKKAEKILKGAGCDVCGDKEELRVYVNRMSPAQVAQLLEKDFVVVKEYGKANYFIH